MMAAKKEPSRPRWGDAEKGSLAWRARYDPELRRKITEGRRQKQADSRERDRQLLDGRDSYSYRRYA